MNNDDTNKLAGVIELLLESSSRINEQKLRRYWYPLSMATYGVEEILEALDSMCSFKTTMWEKTLQFEHRFAQYQGCTDGVMVNSGSSADLLLCLLLTNPMRPLLKPGDEVLIPAVTWPTQVWSAMMAGLKVRLVDVDPKTLNISLDDLQAKLTPRTRAIFLVHLMGNPCEMGSILNFAKQKDLMILEDCCEAMGAQYDGKKVGNFGLGGCFSFFFSHHITTMEGGMIACPDSQVADQLRIMRAHGWLRNVDTSHYNLAEYDLDLRYAFVNWGLNVRPTEVQAGFGIHQLQKLPVFNQRRDVIANRFFEYIDKTEFLSRPTVSALSRPSWLALPLLVHEQAPFTRKEMTDFLEIKGVETRPIVTGNLVRHPVAKLFEDMREGSFPGADIVHQQGFYLGLSPMQNDDALDRLMECFDEFLAKYSK